MHICIVCFVGASFASVCSGDRSRGRKEAGDAAREGHDKGRGIVDDASDRASSMADGIRDKVLWLGHFTETPIAAILTGMQLGKGACRHSAADHIMQHSAADHIMQHCFIVCLVFGGHGLSTFQRSAAFVSSSCTS